MAIYPVVIAGACVAGSRYGLTIGRPIVQSSTWHFTYAETLQFPYPVTVTLLQLVVTYGFLLCLGLLNSIYEHGFQAAFSPRTYVRPISSSIGISSRNLCDRANKISPYMGSKFGSNPILVLETLALAISIAAADVLTSFSLSTAPFEIFLFSCAFTIPVSIVVTRYFPTCDVVSSKAILPAAMLCLGILMAANRPNLPQSPKAICAAVFASILAALWPFQLERALQSPGERSETKYQRIGNEPDDRANTQASSNDRPSLYALQNTILLAIVALTPCLVFSGELGHISRNCYFLKVPNFWIFLFAGAAFRAVLFISSSIFIKLTSALSLIIFTVLIEVSQVGPLSYSKLLSSQWIALWLSLLSGAWLYWSNYSTSRNTSAAPQDSWGPEESRHGRSPFHRWHSQYLLRVVAHVILLAGIIQTIKEHGLKTVPIEESPISHSRDGPALDLLHGKDAYLGPRPPSNAAANFAMLIDECRGTYEHLDSIYNVRKCLDFLYTEQDKYIKVPDRVKSRVNAPVHRYFNLDRSNLDHSDVISVSNNSQNIKGECKDPIIPYHIWWTGFPIWRIELFIKSYLYTQNLDCSKLWIWVNTDHHPGAMDIWLHHPRFQRFMPLVIRGDIMLKEWKLPSRVPLPYHLDELTARYYTHSGSPNAKGELHVADSIIRDSNGQDWIQIYPEGDSPQIPYYTVAVSDAARLIILHLHGGVYMDPDMLLLRDLRPLLLPNQAFAERWGTSPSPEAYNNGLIFLPANSTISSHLLLGGTRMGMMYHFLALGRMLVREGRYDRHIEASGSLLKLENAFFDPIWVENDGHRVGPCSVPCLSRFEQLFQGAPAPGEWDSFEGEQLVGPARGLGYAIGSGSEGGKGAVTVQNRTLENFYRGAYAVHVHNLWGLQYEPGSWIDVMVQAHDGFFEGERANAYGEQWEGPRIEAYLGGRPLDSKF